MQKHALRAAVRRVDPLRDDPLGAKPAGVLENDRAILGNMLVQQDAGFRWPQQARQARPSFQQTALDKCREFVCAENAQELTRQVAVPIANKPDF